MTIEWLRKYMADRGVVLWIEGEDIRYSAPKNTVTNEIKQEIRKHRETLLRELPKSRPTQSIESPGIVVDGQPNDPFPLLEIQQAYYVGRRRDFQHGNVGCHVYIELDICCPDTEKLERSWRDCVESHPMLRAVVLNGGEQQRVLERVSKYQIREVDVSGDSPDDVSKHLLETRHGMEKQVFDPHIWPLFDIRSSRLSQNQVRLHCSFDLIMIDAQTLLMLLNEWSDRYHSGTYNRYQPEVFSYRDYVRVEKELRKSTAYQTAKRYWESKIARLPDPPQLPTGFRSEIEGVKDFDRRSFTIDRELVVHLLNRSKSMGVTINGLLLSAFADVLAVWSNSNEFCVNVTSFGRNEYHENVEHIVGEFTTTVVCSLCVGFDKSFAERTKEAAGRLLDDLEQSAFSGVEVLREMRKHRGGSSVMMPIVFTSLLREGSEGGFREMKCGWDDAIVYSRTQTPQVTLDHQIRASNGCIEVTWDFKVDAFAPGIVDGMLNAFQEHVLSIAGSSLTVHEKKPCFVKSVESEVRRPHASLVEMSRERLEELFLNQVRLRPHSPAVVSADGNSFSYLRLSELAGTVAMELRQRGIGSGELIGVSVGSGIERVVAPLGILMAGGVYVPLDRNLPPARMQEVIDDCGCRFVLFDGELKDLKIEQTIYLDVESMVTKKYCAAKFGALSNTDLAYVIYTSGTTGTPKGVAIEHQSVVNTLLDVNERFKIGPSDGVLSLSRLGFDLSVFDIFGTLAAGASIVLPGTDDLRDVKTWAPRALSERVTIWNSVPALLELLCEYTSMNSDLSSVGGIRVALLSGDWIPVGLVDKSRRLLGVQRFVSLGGATEASIWSIVNEVTGPVDPTWRSIPYGRGLSNQPWYVLSRFMTTCPDFVTGKLYIGGRGLARGYWNDSIKTELRFISHPISGERIYDTGDMGRFLSDGTIELLGRVDDQVKVNGVRIELGEIEAVVTELPAVKSAVALAVGERHRKGLVLCLLMNDGKDVDRSAVKSFLEKRLPTEHCPSKIVQIEELPLSANGKVDRAKVKLLVDESLVDSAREFEHPSSDFERSILSIWKSVLKHEMLGVYENFFEVGGDSIIAIELVSKLSREFEIELSVGDLLRAPTIRTLGDKIVSLIEEQLAGFTEQQLTDKMKERGLMQLWRLTTNDGRSRRTTLWTSMRYENGC